MKIPPCLFLFCLQYSTLSSFRLTPIFAATHNPWNARHASSAENVRDIKIEQISQLRFMAGILLIKSVWCLLSSKSPTTTEEGRSDHKGDVYASRCAGAPNNPTTGLSQPPCGGNKFTLWLEKGGNEGLCTLCGHTWQTSERTHFSP